MKKNKKKERDLLLTQWFEVLIVILIIITIIISVSTIYNCFEKERPIEDIKYIYNVDNNVDYKVHIFKNNFFEEENLGMGRRYMSKLVDDININITNNISASDIANVNYDYIVKAFISAKADSNNDLFDSVLWTKEYTLIPKTKGFNNDSTNSNINIPINIDFETYNSLVTEFQNQMRLDVEANLNVVTTLNYDIYVSGDKISKTDEYTVKVPLAEQTFEIMTSHTDDSSYTTYVEGVEETNFIKITASFVLFFSSLFCGFILTLILVEDIKKTEYVIKLNKILKNYGDVIAGVTNLPNIDDKELYEVKSFNELVNIEEELKIPIIYFEYKKNKEGWFIIMHNNLMYRFILKEK